MGCENVLDKCQAECCSCSTPIEKEIFERNQDHIQENPTEIYEEDSAIVALTNSRKCVFLDKNNRCSIYTDRPELCRLFADESHPYMTCTYIDKNGRVRSRQEKRAKERMISKYTEKYNTWVSNETSRTKKR